MVWTSRVSDARRDRSVALTGRRACVSACRIMDVDVRGMGRCADVGDRYVAWTNGHPILLKCISSIENLQFFNLYLTVQAKSGTNVDA